MRLASALQRALPGLATHRAPLSLSRPFYTFSPSLAVSSFPTNPKKHHPPREKSLLLFQLLKRAYPLPISSLFVFQRYFPTLLKPTPAIGAFPDQTPPFCCAITATTSRAEVGDRDRRNGETSDSDVAVDVWRARRHDESVHASARNSLS